MKGIMGVLFSIIITVEFIGCTQNLPVPIESAQADNEILISSEPSESIDNSSSEDVKITQQVNLDDWLGEYEYLYSTNPDGPEQKVIMHRLSIYKMNDKYYATYSAEGWLTYFVISATVQVGYNEICLLYESAIDGIYLSKTEPIEKGALILKLKTNEDGTLSQMRKNGDAIFRLSVG